MSNMTAIHRAVSAAQRKCTLCVSFMILALTTCSQRLSTPFQSCQCHRPPCPLNQSFSTHLCARTSGPCQQWVARLRVMGRSMPCMAKHVNTGQTVTRDVLLVGRAEPDCLEGGTHEETLRPQVYPKVKCPRFRETEVLSRLLKDSRIR